MLILTTLVPVDVTILTPPSQTVGQSLTLQCEVTTVRGITSRVDIVWSSNGTVLRRINDTTANITNDSVVYSDSYTISQLNTSDLRRRIQCEVVINIPETPVRDNAILELNIIGKYSSIVVRIYK